MNITLMFGILIPFKISTVEVSLIIKCFHLIMQFTAFNTHRRKIKINFRMNITLMFGKLIPFKISTVEVSLIIKCSHLIMQFTAFNAHRRKIKISFHMNITLMFGFHSKYQLWRFPWLLNGNYFLNFNPLLKRLQYVRYIFIWHGVIPH